jgi:two-component system, NtrC family, nitrogen regulation sensor histidine kinase GlnL
VAVARGGLIRLPVRDTAPGADEIMAASPTAILVVDPADIITSVNSAAEFLLNVSAAQLIGAPLSAAVNLPSRYNREEEGAFAAYDTVLTTPRGRRLHADVHISPFADRPYWRLVSLNGTAAAHRVGDRVERGSGTRAAVRIAAMLAHEIKNPLSGIRGAAQLLDGGGDETSRRMTKLIRDEVDRVAALIDRMEGFTDDRPLERAAENIHAIIDHARTVAAQGFARNIHISDAYDPSLPHVLVHRDSMVQIVLNLIKNAVEATDGTGERTILITTAYRQGVSIADRDGSQRHALPIELCVIDSGPGVPADVLDNLFDPFVSSKASGRGLGLALVDKLVRDMGGLIQYAREGNPEQTVFRLLLPRATGKAA